MKTLKLLLRVLIYIIGIMIVALGVVFVVKSDLGAGGWDAVNANFKELTGIKLGYASIGINILLLLFLVLYRKKLKFLIVLFPILTTGFAINFWHDIVLNNFSVINLWPKIGTFALGLLILPIGLAIMIVTKLPAMVFDELTLAFMEITKINSFQTVRLGIETFAVLLAITFGLFAGVGLGHVGVGTFIISLGIGSLINFYVKLLEYIFKLNNKTIELSD